jgi:secondary thiamine-phosphate synthase enzyme
LLCGAWPGQKGRYQMVITESIRFSTRGHGQVVDITEEVARKVVESDLRAGTVTIFTPSATSALTTIEYESGAVADLQGLFDRIVPQDIEYRHNLRWGDGNGHSHVRAALLGASLAVPFVDSRLTLGTWQQIVFVDFDVRPHDRKLVLQIMGE